MGAAQPLKNTWTPPMELLSVPLELTCSGVGVAGPSDCPQTIGISPGETPVASYEAALVTAETTGCGTLMALCASGITNSVIEYAGNVAVRLLPATLMSEVWRTMAARFVWLYCHTCAVPAGAKLARLMVSLISPVVLFSTSTVKAESTRCAAKMESVSGSLLVPDTLVPPNWLPLPSLFRKILNANAPGSVVPAY